MSTKTYDLASADLSLLRVFATVVECGGFSAAQLALGMPQSTLSSQITTLGWRFTTSWPTNRAS